MGKTADDLHASARPVRRGVEPALAGGANAVICFTVNGEVSSTHGAAVFVRNLLAEQDITVEDTCHLSIGQDLMVLAAVEAA